MRFLLAFLLLAPASAWAGSYTITNTFTGGTTAVASEVNANFTAAKTAIDDNDLRIDALLATDTCTSPPCALTAGTTVGGTEIVLDSDIGTTVQAFDSDLSDLADGSLSGSKIGSGLDGATITAGTVADARIASTITRDTEWDTAAEINAATTDLDFMTTAGTQSLVTTGTIQGEVSVQINGTSSSTLVALQMLGAAYYYTGASGHDVTLPGAEAGLNACFYDANGGGVITLDAAAGDTIWLDGVSVGAADAIDSAGNRGDFLCLLGIDTDTWVTLGRSGTWVDGGAD